MYAQNEIESRESKSKSTNLINTSKKPMIFLLPISKFYSENFSFKMCPFKYWKLDESNFTFKKLILNN